MALFFIKTAKYLLQGTLPKSGDHSLHSLESQLVPAMLRTVSSHYCAAGAGWMSRNSSQILAGSHFQLVYNLHYTLGLSTEY